MKNWKTTLAGCIPIIGVIIDCFWPEHREILIKIVAAATAAGLIAASDAKKSD